MADAVEQRIDPQDGIAYTFEEIAEFNKGKFKKAAIKAYWDDECLPMSQSTKGKKKNNEKSLAAKSDVDAEKPEATTVAVPPKPVLRRTKSWLVKVGGIALLPCEDDLAPIVEAFRACEAANDDAGMEAAQLKFLRAHPFVVAQEKPVIADALASGVTCMSYNFKMDVRGFQKWLRSPEGKPFEEKGKGFDDGCYLTSACLRTFLPRGYTSFVFTDAEGKTATAVLRGFNKFTGLTAADEDEVSNATDETDAFLFHGFTQEDATRFAVTTKSNGENGKYSVRKIFGEWYCLAGSKNTGVVWKFGNDVAKLYPVPKDAIAGVGPKVIAHVDEIIKAMSAEQQATFLKGTDGDRLTVMVEFNDNMHEHIFPIPVTRAEHVAILNSRGYPLPQKDATAFFDKFGLFRVKCDVYSDMKELPAVMEQIRACNTTEGAVIYLERNDDTPVGLVKVKSDYYVVARRTRETVRGALVDAVTNGKDVNESLNGAKVRLTKGMKDLQHVGGCATKHPEWTASAIGFAESWADAYRKGDARMRKALAFEWHNKYGSMYLRFQETKNVLPLSPETMEFVSALAEVAEVDADDGAVAGKGGKGGKEGKGRRRK